MPLLILILLVAVFAYLYWQRRSTSLTRVCAWRQQRAAGQWRCVACGAIQPGATQPRVCLRQQQQD